MHKIILTGLLMLFAINVQSAPPPGHPSTDEAARALGLPSGAALSYEGLVLRAVDSNSYTYIEVEGPRGQRLWLAAPRQAELPAGRIRFGDGRLMNNFYSKKLRRTFRQVLFVPAVEVIVK